MKLLWMIAGVALAAGTTVNAQDNEDEDAQKAEKVICKTKKVTGSRTKVNRTCMTRAEWDAQAAAARDMNNKLSRDAAQNPSNGAQ